MKQFLKNNALFYGGIILLLVLFIKELRKFFNDIKGSIKSGFDDKNTVLDNPIVLNTSGTKLDDNQAKLIADRIYHTMAYYGTDETELFIQLGELNNSDFNRVYNAFGLRWYNTSLGTESTNVLGTKYDLIQWCKAELSENEFNVIRSMFTSVS